jgi:hypothetical protein
MQGAGEAVGFEESDGVAMDGVDAAKDAHKSLELAEGVLEDGRRHHALQAQVLALGRRDAVAGERGVHRVDDSRQDAAQRAGFGGGRGELEHMRPAGGAHAFVRAVAHQAGDLGGGRMASEAEQRGVVKAVHARETIAEPGDLETADQVAELGESGHAVRRGEQGEDGVEDLGAVQGGEPALIVGAVGRIEDRAPQLARVLAPAGGIEVEQVSWDVLIVDLGVGTGAQEPRVIGDVVKFAVLALAASARPARLLAVPAALDDEGAKIGVGQVVAAVLLAPLSEAARSLCLIARRRAAALLGEDAEYADELSGGAGAAGALPQLVEGVGALGRVAVDDEVVVDDLGGRLRLGRRLVAEGQPAVA